MFYIPPWNVASTEVLFLSNFYRKVVSAIILASMGSVLVHSFADTVLLYFSVAVWMSYPDGTSVPMYQSYFFLSKNLQKYSLALTIEL